MAHQLMISDETYATISALAKARGETPEALAMQFLQQQVEAEWEAACAHYDDLTASPVWHQMETEVDRQLAAGEGEFYADDAAFKLAFEQH